MRITPKALYGALVLGLAAAACGGGATGIQTSTGQVTTNGAVTLGAQQQIATLPTVGGLANTLTYATGTGTVTATVSTTAPAGVLPITQDPQATAATGSVEYITLTGTAKMSGLPALFLTLPSITASQYNDDVYNGTSWTIISQGTQQATPTEAFNSNPAAEDLNAGPVYIAVYTGPTVGEPLKTPPVCTPGNAICDPGFESGTYAVYPAAPVAGSWTSCTINPASSPMPHPASKYTPVPGSIPVAAIRSFADGVTMPAPAPTSVPTIPPSTPVHSGSYAAALGSQFAGYTLEDFAYNGLCQTVTVPQNATLSMYIYGAGNQASKYADFDVDILDTSNNYVANLYDENVYPNDSKYRNISLDMSPYGGQTVNLFIGLWGSGSGVYYGEYYFVDDMYLGINPPAVTSSSVMRRR
jgi:hypothetical protein